jgi:hypothetical protein
MNKIEFLDMILMYEEIESKIIYRENIPRKNMLCDLSICSFPKRER